MMVFNQMNSRASLYEFLCRILKRNSKGPIKPNIELDNADPLSNMVQLYEEILLEYIKVQ